MGVKGLTPNHLRQIEIVEVSSTERVGGGGGREGGERIVRKNNNTSTLPTILLTLHRLGCHWHYALINLMQSTVNV